MKHLFLAACFIVSAMTAVAQPFFVELRPLEGYFVDPKYPLKKGPNCFVITNTRQFEKMFGRIDKPDAPDFELERVVVMAYPPTVHPTSLAMHPKVAKAGNYMEIYVDASEDKKNKLPYTAYPVVVAAVPIYFAVSKFNFYNEKTKKLIASVPVR